MSQAQWIEPWRTQILHYNLADTVDLNRILTELIGLGDLKDKEITTQNFCTPELTPSLYNAIEQGIFPKIREYAQQCWNFDIDKKGFDWYTWLVYNNGNEDGIAWHYHPNSHIATVFYPQVSTGDLIFTDPRGFAGRGYPDEIANKDFGKQRFRLKSGDVVIFPSYLPHYVEGLHNLRFAIPTDILFKY